MTSRRSRALTLVEILVCMVLLSLVFSAVGVVSYKAYGKVRFERECHKVASKIRQRKIQALAENRDKELLIRWPGSLLFNEREVEEVLVIFYSNGTTTPKGVMALQQGELRFAIEIS